MRSSIDVGWAAEGLESARLSEVRRRLSTHCELVLVLLAATTTDAHRHVSSCAAVLDRDSRLLYVTVVLTSRVLVLVGPFIFAVELHTLAAAYTAHLSPS
jgi:hypothetical protein